MLHCYVLFARVATQPCLHFLTFELITLLPWRDKIFRENTRMRGVMRKYSIEISDDCAQCHDTNDKGCGNGGNNYCLSIDSPESFREEPYQLVG